MREEAHAALVWGQSSCMLLVIKLSMQNLDRPGLAFGGMTEDVIMDTQS